MTDLIANFPRGSEWRKWDLHVHTPETKINDGYKLEDDEDVWNKFCDDIYSSDVEVIGITDYFSLDNFFKFKEKFYGKYPESTKVFFPNMELRINESVNPVQEEVNLHLIFRPDLIEADARDFANKLKTVKTDGRGREVACSQLSISSGQNDFESATVTRTAIQETIKEVFGTKILRQDYVLILAAANNDGTRPARGKRRKEIITDEIDKFCDAFFGGSQNVEYFLNPSRLDDDEQTISAKPVLSGCDAHNFEQLNAWLGQTVKDESTNQEITWIKGDPTFEGLQQILIEPSDRLHIQTIKPDEKDEYKIIDKVIFDGTTDFPEEIRFNSNLCSIIGSRSSGKSALLNYVAHAINPSYVETIAKLTGPAAKMKWNNLDFKYKVVWADGSENNAGQVVFLPQNYLSTISDRPEEITERIKPVLFKRYPEIESRYRAAVGEIAAVNSSIELGVSNWFGLMNSARKMNEEIKKLGDKEAIKGSIKAYEAKINDIKTKSKLTDQELTLYQKVSSDISIKGVEISELVTTERNISAVYFNNNQIRDFKIRAVVEPSLEYLPITIKNGIETQIRKSSTLVVENIRKLVSDYQKQLIERIKKCNEELVKLKKDHEPLFLKYGQHELLVKQVEESNKQKGILKTIEECEKEIALLSEKSEAQLTVIAENLTKRNNFYDELKTSFELLDQESTRIQFKVECSFDYQLLSNLSSKYNQREIKGNDYISSDGEMSINILKAREHYVEYLNAIYLNNIKLKQGEANLDVAMSTLSFSEEVRFSAVMEGDSIGGFGESSMTPGKQALFALTLMLDESSDSWPLLIDQPEDDLDSRSIYDQIAAYFKDKKKERQIIMVSHNANLVIGADSEQVIVANKHGDDRKNENNQMFDYLTGSLEDTKERELNNIVLKSCGIREHACDILDGGEEAFYKREQKYKLMKKAH